MKEANIAAFPAKPLFTAKDTWLCWKCKSSVRFSPQASKLHPYEISIIYFISTLVPIINSIIKNLFFYFSVTTDCYLTWTKLQPYRRQIWCRTSAEDTSIKSLLMLVTKSAAI